MISTPDDEETRQPGHQPVSVLQHRIQVVERNISELEQNMTAIRSDIRQIKFSAYAIAGALVGNLTGFTSFVQSIL